MRRVSRASSDNNQRHLNSNRDNRQVNEPRHLGVKCQQHDSQPEIAGPICARAYILMHIRVIMGIYNTVHVLAQIGVGN